MRKTMTIALLVAAAACGGSNKADKGGGQKGSNAMGTGQMSGGTATGNESMGTQQGDTYEGVTCDSSTEGLAWCDDDTDIAFCSGGTWWLLDCSALGDYFCGDDGVTVDCYPADDF